MIVVGDGTSWAVHDRTGNVLASGFTSNAEAWRWIDKHNPTDVAYDFDRRWSFGRLPLDRD